MKTEEGVEMPRRATLGSAGYDFYAPEDIMLEPGKWTKIDTGVRFVDSDRVVKVRWDEPIEGGHGWCSYPERETTTWFMMLVPRSGLGTRYGVRFRNTVGIIDSDYRDTIKMVLTADEPVTIRKGERIAQGIVIPYGVVPFEIIPSEGRHGGHGSTGA